MFMVNFKQFIVKHASSFLKVFVVHLNFQWIIVKVKKKICVVQVTQPTLKFYPLS